MNPNHNYVYRNQKEGERIIAQFGRKPTEAMKQKVRESLLQEKEKFLAQAQVRNRWQQRQHGPADGRER